MSESGSEEPSSSETSGEENSTTASDKFIKDRQTSKGTRIEQFVMGRIVSPLVAIMSAGVATSFGAMSAANAAEVVSKSEKAVNINLNAAAVGAVEVVIAALFLEAAVNAGRTAVGVYRRK